jgi:sulfate/thiosulfate transport system permease protein
MSKLIRFLIIGTALLFLFSLIVLPILLILIDACSNGLGIFTRLYNSQEFIHAAKLSGIAVICALLLNGLFGLTIAWFITKYEFKGKALLTTLIELPFSISPVITGTILILTFGVNSSIGAMLESMGIKIIFAPLGIILATTFITLPFIAKELIIFMQSKGTDEEQAAYLLGASGFHIFFRVTLPSILPALMVGSILTITRALGEFGAVAVVSGHIRGQTETLPLHIESLYNDYQSSEALAVASILILLALISLLIKKYIRQHLSR